MPAGFLALFAALLLIVLLPVFLADLMVGGLVKLGFNPLFGILTVLAVFLGGLINVPIKALAPRQGIPLRVPGLFGLQHRVVTVKTKRVIALNLGGCLIPCCVVAYQLFRLTQSNDLLAGFTAIAINIAVCRHTSRIVPGVGITMPPLVPGLVAALCALILAPGNAPPVAFCAGVLGPLVGGDLLRLAALSKLTYGSFSIGGAGSFDGIVITGFIALLLV